MIRFADNQNGYREFIQKVDIFFKTRRIIQYDFSGEKKIVKNGRIRK